MFLAREILEVPLVASAKLLVIGGGGGASWVVLRSSEMESDFLSPLIFFCRSWCTLQPLQLAGWAPLQRAQVGGISFGLGQSKVKCSPAHFTYRGG